MKRYLILLLLSFQGLWAQVQFETKVNKNILGLNEKLRVDFVMNIDGDNFKKPSFKGFNIVKDLGQYVSETWKNKKRTYEKGYSYILMPIKEGNFRIKKAVVEFNGKVYKTSSVKINVTDSEEKLK